MKSRLNQIPNLEELAAQAGYRVDRLAKLCGCTDRHLRNYIHATKGKRPREWLLELRMKSAAALLLSGEMNVKEVANASGCAQASHFSRLFKQFYGQSPSQLFANRPSENPANSVSDTQMPI